MPRVTGDAVIETAREATGSPDTGWILADAMATLDTTHVFTLMGDGNMRFLTAAQDRGLEVVEVRHESAAVAMAEGYHMATGRVGFCSVTHGPGLTHTATSLVVARRNRTALVLVVAETPRGYLGAQHFDQRSFVEACEAPYRLLGSDEDPRAVLLQVAEQARQARCPVVLAVPADLFSEPAPARGSRPTGAEDVPRPGGGDDRAAAEAILAGFAAAQRPLIIAGRGARDERVRAQLVALADRTGAALSTTLPAKGLFDGHAQNLGVCGGLAHGRAQQVIKQSDVALAVGSSLDRGTTSSMRLFQNGRIIQVVDEIDASAPHPSVDRLYADAHGSLELVLDGLGDLTASPWFELLPPPSECWEDDFVESSPQIAPGLVDPRRALQALNRHIPADALVIISNGHCSGFSASFVDRPVAGDYLTAQGFGSIGQAMTTALGAALARGRKVVVIEGDSGFMMHAQELETAARSGADLTVVVINDQALGTEYHRLAVEGQAAEMAAVSTPQLDQVGAALGARPYRITDIELADDLAREALRPGTALLEIVADRAVISRHMRWLRGGDLGTVPQ